ncbi:MAG: putative DNA binding domain-containing protein [Prevotella salivae]|uniref:RNA-binding domain-containing protein n=1 Tax=Segatella salivae TaxID=228604 RepID=UPI001CAE986F|nr:ATP-binding protein [Segatella salivae]MBF1521548.1 putative DNA binding domain-containing protein [Segatella salivae]
MTIQEITTRKEDQTFDCKSIQIDPKALAITIVAFANADGGDIAIGVSDKTRKIEGVDQHTEKLNELLRVPLDFCNPSVSITSDLLPCTDKDGNENHILLMHIPASSELHTNQADEAFMRVGDKSRRLSFEERIQLMYDKGERYYEDTAVYGATVDDIDMAAVERYTELIGYTKSANQYLHENNGFITTNAKGEEQVSVACILLFGKYPQKFFPRGRTRFIRYKGTEERVGAEMNVIKDVTFEGTILDLVKAMIAYLETQVEEHTFLGQHGQFVTHRDYPKFVIQEMVVNACCHRAYNIKGTEIQIKMFDNRLVFESPGRLPGTVKPSNIRHTHFSRNPKIAQFLKAYDYVKEFGEGVDRVCRELEANGTPHLSFHLDDFILKLTVPKVVSEQEKSVKENSEKVTDNHLKVSEKVTDEQSKVSDRVTDKRKVIVEKVVAKALENGDKLTSNRITILQLMAENPYITKIELAAAVGISATSIMRNIEYMRNKYLRRVGPDNGGFWEIIE